jgi:oligopeptidase A
MQPWDVAFWAERQRRARYDLDPEALRPYFPLPGVMAGLFDLVHSLYGIKVTEREEPGRWNDVVRYYEVHDEDGAHLGSFYADWHPRESKRGGAWMNHVITGGPRADGSFAPHLGLVCGNLTPPIGDRPALLTHDEVQTVFHEFGHLLHHLLSRVEVKGLAGTNVAWDFVELPSQLHENFTWERAALDRFARHVDTGERLPDALFAKMIAARRFRAATAQHRQLSFALVDLLLHTRFDPAKDGDAVEWANERLLPFQPVAPPAGTAMIASFLHLFGSSVGYAAGYYSYKWAEVLDADAFSRFATEGVTSRVVGRAFRDAILAQGDAKDPAELFVQFLGRPPDPSALLRRVGLA